MTYNILKGGSEPTAGDRRPLLQAVIRSAAPDVLVLNECNGFDVHADTGHADTGRADTGRADTGLARFAADLGMTGRLARADSGYHVALLTRGIALDDWEACGDGFAHAACRARVHVAGRALTLVAAHLDPFDANHRAREVAALLALADPWDDLLLMGDLNAISPRDAAGSDVDHWSERYRARHTGSAGLPDTTAVALLEGAGLVDLLAATGGPPRPTRPTRMYWKGDVPPQRLDYLFASASLAARVREARVIDTPDTQAASDHLPVLADFSF